MAVLHNRLSPGYAALSVFLRIALTHCTVLMRWIFKIKHLETIKRSRAAFLRRCQSRTRGRPGPRRLRHVSSSKLDVCSSQKPTRRWRVVRELIQHQTIQEAIRGWSSTYSYVNLHRILSENTKEQDKSDVRSPASTSPSLLNLLHITWTFVTLMCF